MLRWLFAPAALVAAFTLAGCASNPCSNVLDYRNAQAYPPVRAAKGSKSIKLDPAFEIPAGKKATDDPNSHAACVIYPPKVIDPDHPPEHTG